MKLLLCKTIDTLGIVGDIVNVAAGYGRNYLLPNGLATAPTEGNIRMLREARKQAESERIRNRKLLEEFSNRLEGVEVTVRARANEDGVLYGSVGAREIAEALHEEGHPVDMKQVIIESPIRHLDSVAVEIRLGEDLRSDIKVWVVREKTEDDGEDPEDPKEAVAGTEAGNDGDGSGDN